MFYPQNSIKKLFLCKSGGWQSIINAEDSAEAVTQAMTEALIHFATTNQLNFVVGTAIMCQEIHEDLESAHFFSSSAILANAGFHDLAKDLEPIQE